MKYLKTGGKWLLQVLLAVVMVGPGSQKFTGPTWERMFRTWGYPDGFYLVIGAVEVVGRDRLADSAGRQRERHHARRS